MFLFVVNWADYENTYVNISIEPNMFFNWILGWYLILGHSPQGSAECISSAVLASYTVALWPATPHYSTSPFINNCLTTEILPEHLPCCIPFFVHSLWRAKQQSYSVQVAVNCVQESRVTWGTYAQLYLTRCQYTGAPTDKNDSTLWPGRSHQKLFSDAKGFQLKPYLEPFYGYVFY